MRTTFQLLEVVGERNIAESRDVLFLKLLQNAALLSLRDMGCLTDRQYRYAAEQIGPYSGNANGRKRNGGRD